jgi:ABC-2 type transport system permease protein
MRKVFVIAARDYNAAVRTKAFLIGLLIMPIMMGGSLLMQWLLQGFHDTKEKRFAVVDRTPGRKLLPVIEAAADLYNRTALFDDKGKQVEPRLVIEPVQPAGEADEAVDDLRERLSQRVRNGEIFGFLEVGPDALASAPSGDGPPDQRRAIRYQSNRPTYLTFPNLMRAVLTRAVQDERGQGAGLNPSQREAMMQPVAFESKGLSRRDPATGKVEDASKQSEIAPFAVPFGLMMLMFMVVLMGASPLMQGVVEEKMQRIAEVLLGSVRPFQLMLGKLLGMTGVSLTMAAVYLGGALWAAHRYGFAEYVPAELLVWFFVFQTLASLMYGSLFIAIGAACTDMRETQNFLWPVMLLATMPMFVIVNVLQEPSSAVSTGLSFFPFATPSLMIARQAVPPGVPWWQPALGAAGVLLTTLLCVWAAGRVFRVGLLMQGKGARLGEVARWVFRG